MIRRKEGKESARSMVKIPLGLLMGLAFTASVVAEWEDDQDEAAIRRWEKVRDRAKLWLKKHLGYEPETTLDVLRGMRGHIKRVEMHVLKNLKPRRFLARKKKEK